MAPANRIASRPTAMNAAAAGICRPGRLADLRVHGFDDSR
jgi:hypothetical protein